MRLASRTAAGICAGLPMTCANYLQENTMGNTGLSLGIDIGGTFTDLVLLDPRDGKTTI
jgi:hypothetical protein